tara:strand:- start:641 stop:904 length:264 start_codon:yes stop_codon:yes gene_type:complete
MRKRQLQGTATEPYTANVQMMAQKNWEHNPWKFKLQRKFLTLRWRAALVATRVAKLTRLSRGVCSGDEKELRRYKIEKDVDYEKLND